MLMSHKLRRKAWVWQKYLHYCYRPFCSKVDLLLSDTNSLRVVSSELSMLFCWKVSLRMTSMKQLSQSA